MEDFDSLNEKQLESLERGLSDLKHNRVMTSDEFWKGLLLNKEQQVKDIKYGLMVIDPTQEGEMMDILHFVGYWNKPTLRDANLLREELMTDEEFGLTEIAHRLDILPAPDYIVQEYIKDIESYE